MAATGATIAGGSHITNGVITAGAPMTRIVTAMTTMTTTTAGTIAVRDRAGSTTNKNPA